MTSKNIFRLKSPCHNFHFQTGSFENFRGFVSKYYAELFKNNLNKKQTLTFNFSDEKEKYYRSKGDFFEFIYSKKLIGVFVGFQQDESTYYIRTVGVIKEFQGKGIFRAFTVKLINILKNAGVDRIIVDVSPSNQTILNFYMSVGFSQTGYELTERWGANVKLTKFLNPEFEKKFITQFCPGNISKISKGM